jgi:spore coat polysaccharide biosynthesis predicted glycosyltransferase SpsG
VNDAVLVHDRGDSGLGPRRRMEALADALAMRGFDTALSVAGEPARASIVVVDSYRTRADDNRWYRGDRVVAVDDLRRDLAVDLLVDPSPGARPEWHRSARYVVAGAPYALVDPWLCDLEAAVPGPTVERVLVAFDSDDHRVRGDEIAADLARALPRARVRLAGASRRSPARACAAHGAHGLGAELAAADLVVCGGGVTLLEALTLGRPAVSVCLEEADRQSVDGAAEQGAVIVATPAGVVDQAVALARDPRRRAELACAARSLLDGLGASRVADEIARLCALVL